MSGGLGRGVVRGGDFRCLGLHLHLDLDVVEAFAVDAVDRALRHEGILVDAFYDAEDGDGLDFTAIYYENLLVVFRVPALAVDNRYTAMGVNEDFVGYLLPFRREYHELRGLAVAVDDLVGDVAGYERDHDAIHDGTAGTSSSR